MARSSFWERTKPSNIANPPEWMTFDDAWVEQVRRGLMACKVFTWYPIYCKLHYQFQKSQIQEGISVPPITATN